MAQREGQQNPQSSIKKDRQAVERLPDEINEETPESHVRPLQQDHNRDAARGDWDRSGRRDDQGASREDTTGETRPEEKY